MDLLIQIIIIGIFLFIVYKVIGAIINITKGTAEIVGYGVEFTKIISKIGKNKINKAIENAVKQIEIHRMQEEEKKKIILAIALELNIGIDVAEAILEQYLKSLK
jgi:hypothetical protein